MPRKLTACDARAVAGAAEPSRGTVIPLDRARRRGARRSRQAIRARVLLLGGHALERAGLRRLLEDDARVAVVGEAAHDAHGAALIHATAPDVIIVNAGDWTRRGASPPATTAVLLLTDGPADELDAALQPGVAGVLAKSSRPEQLVEAVRTLADGGALLPPRAVRRLIAERLAPAPVPA